MLRFFQLYLLENISMKADNVLAWGMGCVVKSPFYPHWLNDIKANEGNKKTLKGIHGLVVEVGSGDGSRKRTICAAYPAITRYLATDFSDWNSEFSAIDRMVEKNPACSVLMGLGKRIKPDVICDAMKLPFQKSTFDYHLGFEVLEHIADPMKYMAEAVRVLKPGGRIILSVPYMYRMHGREPDHRLDYYRYSLGFFHLVCSKYRLNLERIVCNTGMGTSVSSMINQWLVRRIIESPLSVKWLYCLLAVICFPLSSCIGYVIDLKPDIRFATRLHIVMRKPI